MENNKIISLNNQEIKLLKSLKKGDSKTNLFVVEGYHLVQEALKNNCLLKVFEIDEQNKLSHLKTNKNIQYFNVSYQILKVITDTQHPQGVVGLCSKNNTNSKQDKIVFLDNVQEPGNVGTIIRLCAAFGFDKVIGNIAFNNSKIIRSSQGAIFNVDLEQINNSENKTRIQKLKESGYQIIATCLDKNSIPLSNLSTNLNQKIVVILGNEGKGINKEILELADVKIYIPCNFESINVACAGAIILDKIYNK